MPDYARAARRAVRYVASNPTARRLARRGLLLARSRLNQRIALSRARFAATRSYPRARGYAPRGSFVPSVPGIGRLKQKLRFRYCETITPDGDTSNPTKDYVMTVNNLNDPDGGAGANQPTGYDQWGAFYKSFKVYKCKIDMIVRNTTSTPLAIGMMPNKSGTIIANTVGKNIWCEYPGMRIKGVGKQSTAGEKTYIKMSRTINMRRLANERLNDDYACTGGDPTTELYLHIVVSTMDGTALPANACQIEVRRTFWCIAYDRKQLALS